MQFNILKCANCPINESKWQEFLVIFFLVLFGKSSRSFAPNSFAFLLGSIYVMKYSAAFYELTKLQLKKGAENARKCMDECEHK